MSNARINIQWQHRAVCMLVAALLLSCAVEAQLSLKRQRYDDIAASYKGEHAVYTDVSQKLVIREEGGQLLAKSTVVNEKLFLSEKSLTRFNREQVHGAGFSYFSSLGTVAYIPEKNDYKMVKSVDRDGNASLTYTGLTKNSITRTSYTIEHEDLHLLPGFGFSNNIPTLSSVFEVSAPKYVKMGFLLKGADTSRIKRTVEEKNGMMIYRFTGTNIPAEKDYSGVPAATYYVAHVIPYVISFRLTGARKDSVLSGSVEAHHKYEYRYVKGLNLETDAFLTKKTAELTRNAYSDRDKVQHIYDWVQKTFHYKALYDDELEGLVPHQADTVCKRMFGDCKDMSSVLMAMCQRAGISAYFVAIGTDNKPYTHEELQSEYLYDHMICAVKLDGEWVFLDGTTHVQPMGENRADIQGKEAYIMLDDHHQKIVKIPVVPASKNVITTNATMNLSYNDVTGTIYRHYEGYPAWRLAENLAFLNRKDEKDEYVHDMLLAGNNKFRLPNYDINARNDGNKDVSINANYSIGGYVQQVKKDYFVNMNINKDLGDTRINDEDRKVAFYNDYKKTIKETVTLNIPKGYRVSYLPKPAKGGVDGLWSYSISYKSDPKTHTVVLTKECVVNTMKINPDQFEAHNKLVDDLKKEYKETVVLTAK